MTDIEDANRIEAKLLLLGNICNNCENLYIRYRCKYLCGRFDAVNGSNKEIKLNNTCEYWKPQL